MVDSQLEALSVDTRRRIFALLVEGPRSVGELADQLPVSRPAVSQHLKVLVEARLATVGRIGTRRVYSADPEGVTRLRDWADQMWEMALGRLAGQAEKEEQMNQTKKLAPVRKEVLVKGPPEVVFRLFTEGIDQWWPKSDYSVAGEETRVVVDGASRRVYEVTREGVQHDWGAITVWEPGQRFVMTWHPGRPAEQATRLEIEFNAEGQDTRLVLVHDGWEARGAGGPEARDGYDRGWDQVLASLPGARSFG